MSRGFAFAKDWNVERTTGLERRINADTSSVRNIDGLGACDRAEAVVLCPAALVGQITKNLSSPFRKNIPLNPQAKSVA
jgi:hypothetical protein